MIKNHIILLSVIFLFSCSGTKKLTNKDIPLDKHNNKQENVVFYVAHQDDDTFISSKIQQHIKDGDSVYVVYTCLSYHRGDDYKTRRVNESYAALNLLGLDTNQIVFLGFPDTRTHEYLDELISSTDSLFSIIKPDVIYTSAYEGGNIDHDVGNFVISYLRDQSKTPSAVYEFPEYSAYKTIVAFFKMRSFPAELNTIVRKLSDEEYSMVKKHWGMYESQHFPLGVYIKLSAGMKKTFGYEYYRPLPYHDYLELPPTNSVAYEKFLKAKFKDFTREVFQLTSVADAE